MNEETETQRDTQRDTATEPQPKPETTPTEPNASLPSQDVGWAGASTSQVVRTVAIALLTTAVVLGALFLPVLIDQINGLIKLTTTAANAPEGPTQYIKGLAKDNGIGGLFQRFPDQLHELRKQLGGVLQNLLSASGQIAISVAGMIAALATVLTLTFFLLLGSERYVNAGVGLFPERHQPLIRRILSKSAGAISGYITGKLAISVICGIITFIVLLLLGMPYAAPLALLVAVLDLIPLVGATLGGALLVVVGLFVEPWKAVVLLVYIVVYQQVEGSVLQPIVYSKAVQLNGLVILIALLVGGQLLGIPGALLAIPVAEIIRIVVTELLAYRRAGQEGGEPAVASSPPQSTE